MSALRVPPRVASETKVPSAAASPTAASAGPPEGATRRGRFVALTLATLLVAGTIGVVALLQAGGHQEPASSRAPVAPPAPPAPPAPAAQAPRVPAPAQVTLAPGDLSFGTYKAGSASEIRDLVVSNAGDATVGIKAIAVDGNRSDFVVDKRCIGIKLAAGVHCTLGLRFAPKSPGPKELTVRISVQGFAAPLIAKALGTGR